MPESASSGRSNCDRADLRNQDGERLRDEANRLSLQIPPGFVELLAERVADLVFERHLAAKPQPYLSTEEAAEYLRCKPKRLYDLCSQRRIPFVKDGSRTLLRREDLDAYLEAST